MGTAEDVKQDVAEVLAERECPTPRGQFRAFRKQMLAAWGIRDVLEAKQFPFYAFKVKKTGAKLLAAANEDVAVMSASFNRLLGAANALTVLMVEVPEQGSRILDALKMEPAKSIEKLKSMFGNSFEDVNSHMIMTHIIMCNYYLVASLVTEERRWLEAQLEIWKNDTNFLRNDDSVHEALLTLGHLS